MAIRGGKVLELLNEVQSGLRLRLIQVEFCKNLFPFKVFDESSFRSLKSFCSMSFSGHSFGSRHDESGSGNGRVFIGRWRLLKTYSRFIWLSASAASRVSRSE